MRTALLILALAAGTAAARVALEPAALGIGKIRDPAWLPKGQTVRVASFGQRIALADLYWLKLVQYVGEVAMTKSNRWEALYPLADLVTDLDPRFGYAYQIAGSNLSGIAGRFAESEQILQKGMRNVPDRWSLPFTLAVNKFLYEGDFAAGARYARMAAEIGHRPHLSLLAANLALVADNDSEYAAAEQLLAVSIGQADTAELRGELEQRLAKVQTYQLLSRAERAVADYERAHGRRPAALQDAAREAGFAVPARDPAGGVLHYDPSTGAVVSSKLGKREPLRVTK